MIKDKESSIFMSWKLSPFVKKKTKSVVELKKGKAEMKERYKSSLMKNIAQTKQGNQSLNQKKLKV